MWLKARADVPYAQLQLQTIQALAKARVVAQTKVAERMRKLVAAGTDSEKDLALAEADLIQSQLTAQKEVFEAETALNTSRRNLATEERQLFQTGVDPHLLVEGGPAMSLVVAEVPENRIDQVHVHVLRTAAHRRRRRLRRHCHWSRLRLPNERAQPLAQRGSGH